ncbi:unnamed protein product [Penicillium discolor]
MAFSPDGKQIALGSSDKTIKLWDTTIGDLQKTLEGHSDWVSSMAFSPDGKQIASGSDDETVKLWDTATGDLQKTLEGHSDWVSSVAFLPDGKQIVLGSDDKTIKLWDTAIGDLQKTLEGHLGWVRSVAFSPDGKQIASGSDDKTIKLWDTVTGDLQKILEGHSDRVLNMAFSPDGKQIASGSDDKTIKLWDIAKYSKSSKFLRRPFARHFKLRPCREIQTSEPVYNLEFSAYNQYLATNIGPIMLEGIAMDKRDRHLHSLHSLFVREQWIFYGEAPFFRLPSDFQSSSSDVQGGQVAIGLRNGQVFSFDIDRHLLQSMLNAPVTIE